MEENFDANLVIFSRNLSPIYVISLIIYQLKKREDLLHGTFGRPKRID